MLGNRAIRDRMEDGSIIIDPFDDKFLGPNSYDITLGPNIFHQKAMDFSVNRPFKFPYMRKGVEAPYSDIWQDDPIDYSSVGYVDLEPHELILAHTNERISCFRDVVGEMKSRSTMMRSGIAICIDAGMGDVGYDGVWTMEIFNHLESTIRLDIGVRIGQMVFHEIEGCDISYVEKGGIYGLEPSWNPYDMLPRSIV